MEGRHPPLRQVRPKDGRWIWPEWQGQASNRAAGSVQGEGSPPRCPDYRDPLHGDWSKKAVTAMNASRPDKIFTIPTGTAANDVMAQLMNDAER